MLPKPKISKLSNLHSIPRYLEHSIPIGSIVALFVLGVVSFNPILQTDTYAKEGDVEESNLTEEKLGSDTSTEIRDTLMEEDDSENEDSDLGEAEREDLALSESEEDTDSSIMTLADAPNATLTVSGNLNEVTSAAPGETSYRSHNVTVNLQDVSSYLLQISYANGAGDALKYDGVGNAYSNIAGAGGKTPANMAANSWGYAWSDNTSAADSGLTYQNVPAFSANTGKTLKVENASGDSSITKSFTGKLAFAAKFASTAPLGHYKTQVLLSLSAAPKGVVSWNNLTTMQEMTNTACAEAPYKTAKTLTDSRDNSTYTIAKLDDGRCWMTQNLRLVNKEINSHDSDIITESWTVPGSDIKTNFTATGAGVYYGNITYGVYYSWCAATAGSCSNLNNSTAPSSICPKGWKLPTKVEYDTLYGESQSSASGGYIIGGGFFPAAGYVSGGGLYGASEGRYWSGTADDSSYAYILGFDSSSVYTTDFSRYRGLPVRCIAR